MPAVAATAASRTPMPNRVPGLMWQSACSKIFCGLKELRHQHLEEVLLVPLERHLPQDVGLLLILAALAADQHVQPRRRLGRGVAEDERQQAEHREAAQKGEHRQHHRVVQDRR